MKDICYPSKLSLWWSGVRDAVELWWDDHRSYMAAKAEENWQSLAVCLLILLNLAASFVFSRLFELGYWLTFGLSSCSVVFWIVLDTITPPRPMRVLRALAAIGFWGLVIYELAQRLFF